MSGAHARCHADRRARMLPLPECTVFPRDFPGKICSNSGRSGSLANCGLARRGIYRHHHPVSAMELALDGWVAHRKVERAGSEASEFNGKRGQAEAGGGGGHFFCPHAGRCGGVTHNSTQPSPIPRSKPVPGQRGPKARVRNFQSLDFRLPLTGLPREDTAQLFPGISPEKSA